jgi:hypothetical protein
MRKKNGGKMLVNPFKKIAIVALMSLCWQIMPVSGADEQDASGKALQTLLEKGQQAAMKGKWSSAIEYYDQAHDRAFFSPQIMYNLAVAHAQAGNELLALVWFRAYLGAAPEAANAGKVMEEIARLEKAAAAKAERLFRQAEQLADELPVKGPSASDAGRRADAFSSVSYHRARSGDFSGADQDRLRAERTAVNGKTAGSYANNEDNYCSYYAGELAKVGDVDGALDAFVKVKNESRRKGLVDAILVALVRSGDLRQARKFLESNPVTDSYAINRVAVAFAEGGDFAAAEKLLRTQPSNCWAYSSLARMQFARGGLSEAVRYARAENKGAEALAIEGDVALAFSRLMANEETSSFQPIGVIFTFNNITKDLLYLGDMRNAVRASDLADEWLDNADKYFSDKQVAKGYALIAKAYLDVENDDANAALKRINKAADLVARIKTSKSDQAALRENYGREFRSDMFEFALGRRKLAVAEALADSCDRNREMTVFLKKIISVQEKKNNRQESERLSRKLAGLEAEARLGWEGADPARAIIVRVWLDAVDALSQIQAVRDLQDYLSDIEDESTEYLPMHVAAAAAEISLGLARIRALARIYR